MALAALAIFTFLGNWTAFFWPLIVTTSSELYTLPIGLTSFAVEQAIRWEMIMTGAALATCRPLITAAPSTQARQEIIIVMLLFIITISKNCNGIVHCGIRTIITTRVILWLLILLLKSFSFTKSDWQPTASVSLCASRWHKGQACRRSLQRRLE